MRTHNIHTCTPSHIHAHSQKHRNALSPTDTFTHTDARRCAHTHAHTLTHARICASAYPHPRYHSHVLYANALTVLDPRRLAHLHHDVDFLCTEAPATAPAPLYARGIFGGVTTSPVWLTLARCCEQSYDIRGAIACLRYCALVHRGCVLEPICSGRIALYQGVKGGSGQQLILAKGGVIYHALTAQTGNRPGGAVNLVVGVNNAATG